MRLSEHPDYVSESMNCLQSSRAPFRIEERPGRTALRESSPGSPMLRPSRPTATCRLQTREPPLSPAAVAGCAQATTAFSWRPTAKVHNQRAWTRVLLMMMMMLFLCCSLLLFVVFCCSRLFSAGLCLLACLRLYHVTPLCVREVPHDCSVRFLLTIDPSVSTLQAHHSHAHCISFL